MAHQVLAVTLQKPLLVAELSFLLAVTQFVVPTFSFVKSSPIPYASHDLLLTGEDAQAILQPANRTDSLHACMPYAQSCNTSCLPVAQPCHFTMSDPTCH